MIVYDIDGGLKHFVAKEETFGIETICGKQIPIDRILPVEDNYNNCDCGDCLYEVDKDLKRRPPKKANNGGKTIRLPV